MSPIPDQTQADIADAIDRIGAAAPVQSNCLFQLALMLARVALEPCTDAYREEAALAVMGLIRAKPKGNVVRLFDAASDRGAVPAPAAERSPGVLQFVAR